MFSFFKSPIEKLKLRHLALLKEARDLQRMGKIPEFARKTAEAEAVAVELESLIEGANEG